MSSAPQAVSIHSRRLPVHPDIDEEMIDRLVRRFYARVREDDELGPIFADAITGDWEPHLLKIIDFWSSVMLKTGRYQGQPMQKHVALKQVRSDHFGRWLNLFEDTARNELTQEVAQVFSDRAHMIAKSLRLGMFGIPGISSAQAQQKTDQA